MALPTAIAGRRDDRRRGRGGPTTERGRRMATRQTPAELRYTDALAAELLRRLGLEAAERTCHENHWDGVLDALRRQTGAGAPPS